MWQKVFPLRVSNHTNFGYLTLDSLFEEGKTFTSIAYDSVQKKNESTIQLNSNEYMKGDREFG